MHNKINNQYVNNVQYCCRVPQGTCGLKYSPSRVLMKSGHCRVPQGTCGLKSPETGANVFRKDVGSRKGPVD